MKIISKSFIENVANYKQILINILRIICQIY